MFNPAYEHPLEIFSWQHLVALGVVLALILIVFFSRKFFMKNVVADRIFRYSLVFLLLFFELIPYFHGGKRTLFSTVISSYPLCGHLLWICAIAFLSNSSRIIKLVYPLAITGALMSLFVLDMDCTFPHFRAFQFFFTHGTFLLGTLYFIFTKKISRYTIKDFRNSCLFLFGLSCFSLLVTFNIRKGGNLEAFDPYFIMNPPGDLMFFKDALGQVGYSLIYILLIFLVQLSIYGITYICTKHRKFDDTFIPKVGDCQLIQKINSISTQSKFLTYLFVIGLGIYACVFANMTQSLILFILDNVLYFLLFGMIVVHEIMFNFNHNKAVLESPSVSPVKSNIANNDKPNTENEAEIKDDIKK